MYMNKVNNRFNLFIICNVWMNNCCEVLYLFNELYCVVCFVIVVGIFVVEISRNNVYILYFILNNLLVVLVFLFI